MARKKTGLTLQDLQSYKHGQPLPTMADVRALLIEQGFTESPARPDNILPPPDIEKELIYLPRHCNNINEIKLREAMRALEALEKLRASQQQATDTLPQELRTYLDGIKDFTYQAEGDYLTLSAREFPEFHFSIIAKGEASQVQQTIEYQLEYYRDANNEASLPSYMAQLDAASHTGLIRMLHEGKPTLHNDITGEKIPLRASDIAELFKTLKSASNSCEDKLLEQYGYRDELQQTHGFTKAEIEQDKLVLEHPRFKRPVAIPVHGSEHYIATKDWRRLQTLVKQLEQSINQPDPGAHQVDIRIPNIDDSLLIFDAGGLFHLAVTRNGKEEDTWLDLINQTKKLPGIGKIIIPDYVADVEMRNQVCTYENGLPVFTELPATEKTPPKAFKELMKSAVRRHVNPHGDVEYITEGKQHNGGKIIIWETEEGRERAIRMKQQMNNGDFVKREPNFGERQIEQLITHELDWYNPVNVITSDLNWMLHENPPKETATGALVSYDTPYTYVEAELNARPKQLAAAALGLRHTDTERYIAEMLERNELYNDNLRNPHLAGHDEADHIHGIIANAVNQQTMETETQPFSSRGNGSGRTNLYR